MWWRVRGVKNGRSEDVSFHMREASPGRLRDCRPSRSNFQNPTETPQIPPARQSDLKRIFNCAHLSVTSCLLNISSCEPRTVRSASQAHLLTSVPAETSKMASKDLSACMELLKSLQALASQIQEPGDHPAKLKQVAQLAQRFVAACSLVGEHLKEAQMELASKKEELKRREDGLDGVQSEIDERRAALESEKTLKQLGVDVGKMEDREVELKKELLTSREETRTEVTESEGRLTATLKACGKDLGKDLKDCLEAIASCEDNVTAALSTYDESLGGKLAECLASSNYVQVGLTEVISLSEDKLMGRLKGLGDEANTSVSSCREAVLGKVSSCEEAIGTKLDGAVQSIDGLDGLVKGMGELLAMHVDEMSTSLSAEHSKGMEKLGREMADSRAFVTSELDSKSKESVTEVTKALGERTAEALSALNGVRTEFAGLVEEDRLSTIFEKSARADEILGCLKEVQGAVERPDTSVFDAVSEVKEMLQSSLAREDGLKKALEDAQTEAKVGRANLKAREDERDRLAAEVSRLNSDMDQLKTKLPATPRRSERDPGSESSALCPGDVFEQEMLKAADAVEKPSGPSVADLQQKIQQLEEELRQSKESRQKEAESLVSKKYLDDALASMTSALSLRDRNEVEVAREEQAKQVAELEKQVQESAKRAEDAEKDSGDLRNRVAELTGQISALENEQETVSPGGGEPRSRKRVRLQQDSSSLCESSDETLFGSMCSAVHEAMDKVKIRQSDQPGLSMAELVINMTRAFAFTDREERLMRFIRGDQTHASFCFGCLVLRDEPPDTDCMCRQLQGGRVNKCLSLRVLDNATMEVEFGLVGLES